MNKKKQKQANTNDIFSSFEMLNQKPKEFRPKTLAIIQKAEQIISQYNVQMTIRQIYYRFVAEQIIPNNLNSYKKLARILGDARKAGYIDFNSIVDRTRQPIKDGSWPTTKDFFSTVKTSYRRELLKDQDKHIEVWIEKDALAGVLEPVTNKYDVYLQVCRGYPSLSSLYQADVRMRNSGKSPTILYFGDFDPSGKDISRSIGDSFMDVFFSPVVLHEIALTREDIDNYKLPPSPAKSSDSRYRDFVARNGNVSVELDALPPDVLVAKAETAIRRHIDIAKYENQLKRESRDKTQIENLLAKL